MELKDFLENNPLLNKKQLAQDMWPENKSAASKLYNKLSETTVGSGKQRITPGDMENAKKVLKKLADEIDKFIQEQASDLT